MCALARCISGCTRVPEFSGWPCSTRRELIKCYSQQAGPLTDKKDINKKHDLAWGHEEPACKTLRVWQPTPLKRLPAHRHSQWHGLGTKVRFINCDPVFHSCQYYLETQVFLINTICVFFSFAKRYKTTDEWLSTHCYSCSLVLASTYSYPLEPPLRAKTTAKRRRRERGWGVDTLLLRSPTPALFEALTLASYTLMTHSVTPSRYPLALYFSAMLYFRLTHHYALALNCTLT